MAMADETGPLYLGLDLSTQQLKGLIIDSNLKLQHEVHVDFDNDFSSIYGIEKGVLVNPAEHEIYAPVAMWLEAIDLLLARFVKKCGRETLGRIKGISGAGMQHGTVFWSTRAEEILAGLNGDKTLVEQVEPSVRIEARKGAFSHPFSPNWQDASTQAQCDAFETAVDGADELARITGSSAHHRFSGPQILRWQQRHPQAWAETARISLVSSFIASIFLGKIAPIDISDVCGMNLWDMPAGTWQHSLLNLASGANAPQELAQKLGQVSHDGGQQLGSISSYFVERYGFSSSCAIVTCTGDNPATLLSIPLHASDAIVSLGTSTTFLMTTTVYRPDPAYHFMNHPATTGEYMFMLCYKNGGLAREQVRDALDKHRQASSGSSWDEFDKLAMSTPPMSEDKSTGRMRMGLYFPRAEIVPNVAAGQWRYEYDPETRDLTRLDDISDCQADARNIIESQMLSLRLRSANLVTGQSESDLPAQPRRIYLVGGGSVNPAIAAICGQVLGGTDGVYRLDIGSNACALGAAQKAVWACERHDKQSFTDLIESRWDESKFVKKIDQGYRKGVFELYGRALEGFGMMEKDVLRHAAESKPLSGGVVM